MAACLPVSAHAADAYYFFGDSLTAQGPSQTAPVMWSQVLEADTGTPGADFAVGGATTTGYLSQVSSFLNSGDKITSNSVAAIWIGTNNIQIGAAQGQGAQAIVQSSLANIRTGIQEMVNAGVKNFVVLGVFDVSLANSLGPMSAASLAMRSDAAAASQMLNAQLAALAVPGANIKYFDVAAFINQLQMHPQLYGFTQIIPLQPGATCNAACQQTSIFADQIHLSARAQQLLGDYIASGNPIYNGTFYSYGAIFENEVNSTASIQATVPLIRYAVTGFADTIFDKLDQGRGTPGKNATAAGSRSATPWSVFTSGNASYGRLLDTGQPANVADLYAATTNQTAGFQYSIFPEARIGVAFNHTYIAGEYGSTIDSRTNLDAYQTGLYASLGNPSQFVDAIVLGSLDQGNQTRSGSFGVLQSTQRGYSILSAVRGGYLFSFGPVAVGPTIGATFDRTWLDGYQEAGGTMYAMGVDPQASNVLIGTGGFQIRPTSQSDCLVDPFLNVVYEHQFVSSSQAITSYLVALPTQTFQTAPAVADPNMIKVSFGTAIALSQAWRGYVNAFGSVGFGGSYAAGGRVGLMHAF